MSLGGLSLSLLLSLLGLHDDSLEVILHLLDCISFVGDLTLEVGLEGLKARDLLVDELYTLLDVVLALGQVLLRQNGTNQLVDCRVFGKQLKLLHYHLVLSLLRTHRPFVLHNLFEFYIRSGLD
mgnify:CR=1 FL=1